MKIETLRRGAQLDRSSKLSFEMSSHAPELAAARIQARA
jgi:hypothetical protein